MQKELSKQDQKKLDKLNLDVENAIKKRKEWLDSKMTEYAKLQVGDDIYNM